MKPILILQLRENDTASDGEFNAFLRFGNLDENDVVRVRMERDGVPDFSLNDYSGVIIGGGPWNVSDPLEKQPLPQQESEASLAPILKEIIENDFPFFGACYGLGILSKVLGTSISKEQFTEPVAPVEINLTESGIEDPLLKNMPETFLALGGHKEAVQDTPSGSVLLASSKDCPVHLIRVGSNIYASQFHPELDIEGICTRIDVYKHAGYFPPEDAEDLKAEIRLSAEVTAPMEIFRHFVDLCRKQN